MNAHELAHKLLKLDTPSPEVYYYHPEWMSAFQVNSLDIVDGKVYLTLSREINDDQAPERVEMGGA